MAAISIAGARGAGWVGVGEGEGGGQSLSFSGSGGGRGWTKVLSSHGDRGHRPFTRVAINLRVAPQTVNKLAQRELTHNVLAPPVEQTIRAFWLSG